MSQQPSGSTDDFPGIEILDSPVLLSLKGLIANLDHTTVAAILTGGYDLKSRVRRNGFVRFRTDEGKYLIIRHAPTKHTDEETSLKRWSAAAGVYAASHADFVCRNSLAEAHGLSGLRDKDREMYYLYNMGLDYEAEMDNFEERVFVLLFWRMKHDRVLFGTEREAHEKLGASLPHLESRYPTKADLIAFFERAKPLIEIVRTFKPTMSRAARMRESRELDSLLSAIYFTPNRRDRAT